MAFKANNQQLLDELEQNIVIFRLDDIAHEQTIIWRQLFAGHVLGSQPM